jgi:DnaJ-class molecular chaperone
MPGSISDSYEPLDDDEIDCEPDDYGPGETCWLCHGQGGWHECGDDTCPCLNKDITDVCPECDGKGEV